MFGFRCWTFHPNRFLSEKEPLENSTDYFPECRVIKASCEWLRYRYTAIFSCVMFQNKCPQHHKSFHSIIHPMRESCTLYKIMSAPDHVVHCKLRTCLKVSKHALPLLTYDITRNSNRNVIKRCIRWRRQRGKRKRSLLGLQNVAEWITVCTKKCDAEAQWETSFRQRDVTAIFILNIKIPRISSSATGQ